MYYYSAVPIVYRLNSTVCFKWTEAKQLARKDSLQKPDARRPLPCLLIQSFFFELRPPMSRIQYLLLQTFYWILHDKILHYSIPSFNSRASLCWLILTVVPVTWHYWMRYSDIQDKTINVNAVQLWKKLLLQCLIYSTLLCLTKTERLTS